MPINPVKVNGKTYVGAEAVEISYLLRHGLRGELIARFPDLNLEKSPTYASDISNTAQEGLPIALAYGLVRIGGNILRTNDATEAFQKILVGHCQGPIHRYISTTVNGIDYSSLVGINLRSQLLGTDITTGNALFSDSNACAYRNVAYTAFQFTKGSQAGSQPTVVVTIEGKTCVPIGAVGSDYLVKSGTYKWTASGSGTNEYYCEANAGGDPGLSGIDGLKINSLDATEDTIGSLAAGTWAWGNNDSLGYNTVYVRLSDGADPDAKAGGYVKYRTWTRNPAIILYNFLMDVEGYSQSDLDTTSFQALKTYCDAVPSGGTLSRYRFDFVFDTDTPIIDSKNFICSSFHGTTIRSQGVIKVVYDSSKSSSHAFTKDNIVLDSFTWEPAPKVNTVRVKYLNSANNYMKEVVELRDRYDIDINGEIVLEQECYFITDKEIALRRVKYLYDKIRYTDYTCSLTGFPNSQDLEVYDLVTVTHDLAGWTAKNFIVTGKTEDEFGRPKFELAAYYSGIYNDGAVDDQSGYASTLPNPYSQPSSCTSLSVSEVSYINKDGRYVPTINLTYSRPDDQVFWRQADIYIKQNDDADYRYYGVDKSGGTGYRLDGDTGDFKVGQTVYVRVVSINDLGIAETAASAPTANVDIVDQKVAPPAPTGLGLEGWDPGTPYVWKGNKFRIKWRQRSQTGGFGRESYGQELNEFGGSGLDPYFKHFELEFTTAGTRRHTFYLQDTFYEYIFGDDMDTFLDNPVVSANGAITFNLRSTNIFNQSSDWVSLSITHLSPTMNTITVDFTGPNCVLNWTPVTDASFKHYRVQIYSDSGRTQLKRTEYVTNSHYLYTYEKNVTDNTTPILTVYFTVTAYNIFDQTSAVNATGTNTGSLNIRTNLYDLDIPLLSNIVWSSNGVNVSWSSGTLMYQGTVYSITGDSGSSSNKYVYWDKNSASTTFHSSATRPSIDADIWLIAYYDVTNDTVYPASQFKLIHAGYLQADSITANEIAAGTITGTEISAAATITAGTGTDVGVLDGADATYRVYAGHSTPASAPFRVTKAGAMTATSATITGSITATTGTIGGFNIGATSLSAGTTHIILDSTAKAISINNATYGQAGLQFQYNAGTPRIYAGDGANAYIQFDGAKIQWKATNSELDASGNLTATSVNLSGTITASSGAIGGFTIGASSISVGTTHIILDSTTKAISINNATYGQSGLQFQYNAGTPRFYAGDGSNAYMKYDGTKIEWKAANTTLDASGNLTATSVDLAGAITASSGSIAGWTIGASALTAGTGATAVGVAPSTYPFYAGNATAANAPFRVTNTGVIRLGNPSGTYLDLDGVNVRIRSSNFVSGALGTGWQVDASTAEFNNIRARGKITTAVFEKDVISSIGGNLLISDSDILNVDMTALDASTLTIVGDTTFAVNDILRIKDGVDDEWLLVTNIGSAPTYTVTRDQAAAYAADTNPIWKKGTAVVNYGASGEGLIFMTASDANAPHINIITHAGAPWSTTTTAMRMGNLNGFLGYVTNLYGIAIGETNKYLKYDATNGLQIKGIVTMSAGSDIEGLDATSVAGWSHASDTTKIDGGDIYTNTVTASQIAAGTITTTEIAANTIVAGNIAASTITATEMNVSTLSAISADLGTITAGTITGALIRTAASGQRFEVNNTDNRGTFYNSAGNETVRIGDSVWGSFGGVLSYGTYYGQLTTNFDGVIAPIASQLIHSSDENLISGNTVYSIYEAASFSIQTGNTSNMNYGGILNSIQQSQPAGYEGTISGDVFGIKTTAYVRGNEFSGTLYGHYFDVRDLDGVDTVYAIHVENGIVAFGSGGYFNPPRYAASTQPGIGDGQLCIWRDTDDGKIYLIYDDADSGAKKIELA